MKRLAVAMFVFGFHRLFAVPSEQVVHEFLSEAPRFDLFPPRSMSSKIDDEITRELADLKFRDKYGVCGMTRLKSNAGGIWVFSTFVGYAGTPGEDIYVVLPDDRIEREFRDLLGDWMPIRLTRR